MNVMLCYYRNGKVAAYGNAVARQVGDSIYIEAGTFVMKRCLFNYIRFGAWDYDHPFYAQTGRHNDGGSFSGTGDGWRLSPLRGDAP